MATAVASSSKKPSKPPRNLVKLQAAVELTSAVVRCGGNVILDDVDLAIPEGTRAAILGPNGCGKSTLLRTIAGIHVPESGDLTLGAKKMAWLRQESTAGSKATVMGEAVSEMASEEKLALDEATAQLQTAETPEEVESAMEAFEKANEGFEAVDGYAGEDKAVAILTGLGFTKEDFDRPCSELSGGWQMKVALARALLTEGDLLLLDEPTNHMDASAKNWLANYLSKELPKETTLMVVTHDRSLLQQINLNTVVEISEKNLMSFDAESIDDWAKARKKLGAEYGKRIEQLTTQCKIDLEWARKWGAKTAFATKAQARLKGVARMKREIKTLEVFSRGLPADEMLNDGKESEKEDGMLPLADMGRVSLKLPEAPLKGRGPPNGVLLDLEEASVGYAADKLIIDGIDLKLKPGYRVALVGPNGAGKTTLLRNLLGTMELISGKRTVGESESGRVSIDLFTQDLAQDLPADASPVDYVEASAGTEEAARRTLGALGLKGEVHKSMIGHLSGGEKARVALAVFATTPTDVLLMDEPTNHLDRIAVKSLAAGLKEHAGVVLVSSHDQAFIDALDVTHHAVVTKAKDGKPGSLKLVEVKQLTPA